MNEIIEVEGDKIELIEPANDIHKGCFDHFVGVRLRDGALVLVFENGIENYSYCVFNSLGF